MYPTVRHAMLAVSMSPTWRLNMSVRMPAGTFIAPIAAERAPSIPPTATSLMPRPSFRCGSKTMMPC